MSSRPILGYWDIRGLCNPIRFLLAYLDIDYEEKLYPHAQPPHKDEIWLNEKFNLGLHFPNLPYWIERDIKLTESKAILKFIAREKDPTGSLLPNGLEELRLADMLENVTSEIMYTLLFMYCWRMENEEEKARLLGQYEKKLGELSVFLGQEKKWVLGNKMSYVDFLFYEALYLHSTFNKECLQPYQNLQNYMFRFESIPAIAKYLNSDKCIKAPCNSPLANHHF